MVLPLHHKANEMDEQNVRKKTILKPIRWRKPLYEKLERLAKKKKSTIAAVAQDIIQKHI